MRGIVGTNRRYAAQIDERMNQKILDQLAAKYPIQALSEGELRLDLYPVTTDPQPRRVRAWVRFGAIASQIEGDAVAWTPRAVQVKFLLDGKDQRVWVWASAVDRVE